MPLPDPPNTAQAHPPSTPPRTPTSGVGLLDDVTPTGPNVPGASHDPDTTPTKSITRDLSSLQLHPAHGAPQADEPSPEQWQWKYKTMYDLLSDPNAMPQTPPIYKKGNLSSTKDITKAEFDIASDDELMYLVYLPSMLDPVKKTAQEMLTAVPVSWETQSNIVFALHCLPHVPGRLLAQAFFSESDVVSWSESTILRPSLAAFRACQATPAVAQLLALPRHPSMSSAASKQIIPDRLLLKDVQFLDPEVAKQEERAEIEELRRASQERDEIRENEGFDRLDRKFPSKERVKKTDETPSMIAKAVPILTVELKTHHVWSSKLFKDVFAMPDSGNGAAHTMRFAWPVQWHDPTTRKGKPRRTNPDDATFGRADKETRVIIQVWCQMVHQKIDYAILSCHQTSVFLIRRGKTLYMSRKYTFADTPQLSAFCHLLLATGTVTYTEKELPPPKVPKEWAETYSKEKLWSNGAVGLMIDTVWKGGAQGTSSRPQRGKAAAQA